MILVQREFYSSDGAYSYLLRDPALRGVIVVDPAPEWIHAYATSFDERGHEPVFILETGSVRRSREASRAIGRRWRARGFMPCDRLGLTPSVPVGHGDSVDLGGLPVSVVGRVGRVNEAVSYCFEGRVFVGDRWAHEEPELLALPEETLVFRSHSARGDNRETLADVRNILAFESEDWKSLQAGLGSGARTIGPQSVEKAIPLGA
ncbi:MAG: hypothetical protein OSB70_04475 [Myxococcota bacterium]|nr:hypothetical protein [Myxococcota bacterium]